MAGKARPSSNAAPVPTSTLVPEATARNLRWRRFLAFVVLPPIGGTLGAVLIPGLLRAGYLWASLLYALVVVIGCSVASAIIAQPGMARRFTVLFVDDDNDVRDIVKQILLAAKFKVLTAADGYEAIRVLVANHVDLLFTDILMPGISGYELATQARLVRPSVRIVYTSAYDGDAPGKEMAAGFGKLLQKPIRAGQLVSEIDEVLSF